MEPFESLISGCIARYNEYLRANQFKGLDFLVDVEKDIENINNTGIVKFTFFDKKNGDEVNTDKSKEENSCNETNKISDVNSHKNIKLERVSEDLFESSSEMPPPRQPVKREKKRAPTIIKTEPSLRCTRSKTAKSKAKDTDVNGDIDKPKLHDRDSDVVLQRDHVSLIMVSDSDDENTNTKIDVDPTKNLEQKKEEKLDTKSKHDDTTISKMPHPEKTSKKVVSKKESSIYEDCISIPEKENDATFTAATSQPNNVTFVQHTNKADAPIGEPSTEIQQEHIADINTTYSKPVQKSTFDKTTTIDTGLSAADKDVEDLMTDDESIHENKPVKYQKNTNTVVIKKTRLPIFSPYENSPVKNRVAAFEKLQSDDTTGCITRTKTKNKAKQVKANDEEQLMKNKESELKLKSKITPLKTNRILPSYGSNSASKIMNYSSLLNKEVKLPRAATTLKSSQQEYKEREMRRRERESEAVRKKEELYQLQMEEKRRKREERHLKAQQTRDEQEKSKQKLLEMHKLKEEKYKQAIAEKQKKLQKQYEEAEKKRMQVLKTQKEEKKKAKQEEVQKLEKENKIIKDMYKKHPIYMTEVAPLLPTVDGYDSDDSEQPKIKVVRPIWQQSNRMMNSLMVTKCTGPEMLHTFFCCESQTPDLSDIFEHIDPKKLKRNSSAIWHKAPKFAMMPIVDSFNESDENED